MYFNLIFNESQIEGETSRAILIKYPRSSYKFWFPKSLVESTGKRYRMSIPEDFQIKIFKNGSGRHNFKEIIDEREVDLADFLHRFGYNINLEDDIIEELLDDEE